MEPQLWIAIILVSILAIFKLMLIMFSTWYEDDYLDRSNNLRKNKGKYDTFYGSLVIMQELNNYGVVLALNIFALYGLNCALKGGCVAYSYIIVGLLLLSLLTHMSLTIAEYKVSENCGKLNCRYA